MEVVDGILGVTVAVELDEGEAVLERDIGDFSVSTEEVLNVAVSSRVRDATKVHPGDRKSVV